MYKLYTSAVFPKAVPRGIIVNGRLVFEATFVGSFLKDDIGGGFPHWANILESEKLDSTGVPLPTAEKAKKFRLRIIENQKEWHGAEALCLDINGAMGDDSPNLSQFLVFLAKEKFLSYQSIVGWGTLFTFNLFLALFKCKFVGILFLFTMDSVLILI